MIHKRRDFMKGTLGSATLLSLSSSVPEILLRSALAGIQPGRDSDTVLVMVQLTGGNDGLNTVVPYGDDSYSRHRKSLRLSGSEVHKIDSLLGFHPRMQAFSRLFQEGRLSVVQGVGYPNGNRDHFQALRNWHTAAPAESTCQTGWLGRAVDQMYDHERANMPGAFVGSIAMPFSFQAERVVVPSLRNLDQCTLHPMPGNDMAHRQLLQRLAKLPRSEDTNRLLHFLQRRIQDTYAMVQRIEDAIRTVTADKAIRYPDFQLAQSLRVIAQLIRAELGIRIFLVELGGGGIGGFDNHAIQRDNHAALLHELSESVAALDCDLLRDGLLDRVLLMTYSEFGRTLAENGRRGTGHGDAAPMFLAGGKLRGGLIGSHPDLADLNDGAPKFLIDYRQVYATALDHWLGVDSKVILGRSYEPIDFLDLQRA